LNTLPVAYWSRKKLGGKLVYDSHELFTETSTLSNLERVLAKVTEKLLIHKADNIITVNESIANELSTRYKVAQPTVIMNCPVIMDRLNISKDNLLRQSLGIDKEIPIILYHGGFSPNRGLQNLVNAALHLKRGIIVFMGWGKIEQELRDLVETNGVGDKVKFAKPVPQENLLNFAQSANLGVIPYQAVGLNNYYTTPNKLFEYLAAGLPVVGSHFPELSKIIKEWNLGKTFNPDDPKDIAEAIMDVLEDKNRYEQMKKNAVKASNVFNWENESKKLSEIYKKYKNELTSTSN
jgi:glycosyltransferase involved in cell wall biosynthesis